MTTGDVQQKSGTASVETGVRQFEDVLLQNLERAGLPADGVVVPLRNRARVLKNFEDAIGELEFEHRANSLYLSKFFVAVGAGLFDAALNYLWDETISELRSRIVLYDLQYFFSVAVQDVEKRKNFSQEADLQNIDDNTLIATAQKISLISEVGQKQLDLIRYMRNWASAAHPNQNEIEAMQLLGWLEVCITHVINRRDRPIVADVKRMLENVRKSEMSDEFVANVAHFFGDLTPEMVNSIAVTLFGMFNDLETSEMVRDNIRRIFPRLWNFLDERDRRGFGSKYGRLIASGDEERAKLARQLLDIAGAEEYIPEPLRAAEIAQAADALLAAHNGYNNFYTEPPLADVLSKIVGDRPIPIGVRDQYVATLNSVFVTNGRGVAVGAEPTYIHLISRLSREEAEIAVLSIFDAEMSSKMQFELCQEKYWELVDLLNVKVSTRMQNIIEEIDESQVPLSRVRQDGRMKALIAPYRDDVR